jgi:Glycosyl transferase 4-like domain
MRRLLIVSPVFPPANAPDMHRVRMSLPYFRESGWEPRVLTVDPALTERVIDPALEETVPRDVPVHRAKAFDPKWTRKLGFSAIGLRALPFLYREGARLIRQHRPDLIYFSTTAFPVLALGRVWKRRFGVPFVIDLQDPWVGEYYDKRPRAERPPKYALAQMMHGMLESFTIRRVGGIIAVSEAYHETLRKRYPWITTEMCRAIPFGASEKDFEVAGRVDWQNPFFTPGDGLRHGVCVGVLGRTKTETCRGICIAFKKGFQVNPDVFSKMRLHFVGTDYARAPHARETIRPIAIDYGLEKYISEQTGRIPYLSALRLCGEADFLLVLGSDDPQYTASKIYPYILARKPTLCVFREESSVVRVMEETRAASVVAFTKNDGADQIAMKIWPALTQLLQRLPFTPATDWKAFEPYQARELTRKQCELFDAVVNRQPTTGNRPPSL